MIEFHATGWLHKAFWSGNVLFFNTSLKDEATAPAFTTITDPHIVGFGVARPQAAVEISERVENPGGLNMLYMHPSYADGAESQPVRSLRRVDDEPPLGVGVPARPPLDDLHAVTMALDETDR